MERTHATQPEAVTRQNRQIFSLIRFKWSEAQCHLVHHSSLVLQWRLFFQCEVTPNSSLSPPVPATPVRLNAPIRTAVLSYAVRNLFVLWNHSLFLRKSFSYHGATTKLSGFRLALYSTVQTTGPTTRTQFIQSHQPHWSNATSIFHLQIGNYLFVVFRSSLGMHCKDLHQIVISIPAMFWSLQLRRHMT